MKIIARLLTVDMYNVTGSRLSDRDGLRAAVENIVGDANCHLLDMSAQGEKDFSLTAILLEGHLAIHTYADLRYAAVDIYLCSEDAEPEMLAKPLRNLFKPEKTKTTYLKRGDFGTVKDAKPSIKTRVAPLRRIHNTGAKVIRLLARRGKNKQ